jgi:hypothetical protein
MEVAAIDERDLDRRTPQLRHRLQPAETSADDDVVFPGPRWCHRAHPSDARAGVADPASRGLPGGSQPDPISNPAIMGTRTPGD